MLKQELQKLTTEQRNPNSMNIDRMTAREIAALINDEDKKVALAVEAELDHIAEAIDAITERFLRGGRMIYTGSGTSGRLGTLDAVELLPTYSISPERAFGIIAGKREAMYYAVEGAEDSVEMSIDDLKEVNLAADDVVIAVAASGRTPYGIGSIEYAQSVGALTVSVTCNAGSPMDLKADISIAPVVGPEVITGSTRMKAGTAQKMVLNMISTGVMVRCGKVYQNLMVNVQASNEKLISRSIGIIRQITGLDEGSATELFERSGRSVAVSVVMQEGGVDVDTAKALLAQHQGHVRHAVDSALEGKQ